MLKSYSSTCKDKARMPCQDSTSIPSVYGELLDTAKILGSHECNSKCCQNSIAPGYVLHLAIFLYAPTKKYLYI